jgi:hypothetical protein
LYKGKNIVFVCAYDELPATFLLLHFLRNKNDFPAQNLTPRPVRIFRPNQMLSRQIFWGISMTFPYCADFSPKKKHFLIFSITQLDKSKKKSACNSPLFTLIKDRKIIYHIKGCIAPESFS